MHWTTLATAVALLCGPVSAAFPPRVTIDIPADEMPPPPNPLGGGASAPASQAGFTPISFQLPKYELPQSERELVASCLILEAASQGDYGMRGVMAVIRNRSRNLPELFATTVLKEKQFSALNKLTSGRESLARVVRRAQRDRMWETALAIVDDATREDWRDPTGGATHYTRTGERTSWTRALARTTIIGRHAFYR